MRMSTNVKQSTSPISSLGSDDMACSKSLFVQAQGKTF